MVPQDPSQRAGLRTGGPIRGIFNNPRGATILPVMLRTIALLLAAAGSLALAAPVCAQTSPATPGKTELDQAIEDVERGRLDAAKARFEKLANAGDAVAQFYLGDLIVHYAASAHKAEGLIWLDLSAKAGVPNAMNALGVIFSDGKIVPKDENKAQAMFMQAASLGFLEAYNNLGLRSAQGIGRPADAFDAMEWFRLAAEQGFAEAQQNLGIMIVNSGEAARDPKKAAEAYMWLTLAGRQGDLEAQAARSRFMQAMKPAEIAEGDRLVQAWRKVEKKKP
ncbi:MAG: tetratricopeptide repeat protein [Rhodospirillales bacterium]